jgi:tRNA-2-methylthio-N6-dimethylallyladenosine synthase
MKKKRPGLKVAVAGCIAQQMGEGLMKRAPHVDYMLGPQNIRVLGDLAKRGSGIALEDNPDIAGADFPAVRGQKGRAWVTIMYGCDNFCTYCVVPYTRGRERSRPSENIVNEIRGLASDGCKEVTLLGQNVNSYKSDTSFPGLLEKINRINGMERVRFVTSHPRDLGDELIEAMAGLEKVCENIHLPFQSGSNRILGLMNRGYSYDQYREKIEKIRARVPGVAITTDIIAGFPTETEEDHRDTKRALEEIRFDGIFAFRYSKRPDTAASTMEGQLDEEVKLGRLHEILEIQDDITLSINKALEGSVQEILVEGEVGTGPSGLAGRMRTNKIVHIKGGDALEGKIIPVRIRKAMRHSLEGEVLEEE